MAIVETEIDGRTVEVERDRWALDVAREMGIEIPSLCHHPALPPYGACRLCVVEVSKGQWTWLATACDLPIREGLHIRTSTPAVIQARKMALELLWSQAPEATEIQDIAKRLGVTRPRFVSRTGLGKCILCGLCIRTCRTVLGQPAICVSRRGTRRRVGTAFGEASETCTGCLACVRICPTGHIISADEGSVRHMTTWNTDLDLVPCQVCGAPFATTRELDLLKTKIPEQYAVEPVCAGCRRSQTARQLGRAENSAR